jgi:hypothetical protein
MATAAAERVRTLDDVPEYQDAVGMLHQLQCSRRDKLAEIGRLQRELASCGSAQDGIDPEVAAEAARLLGKSRQTIDEGRKLMGALNRCQFDLQAIDIAIRDKENDVEERRTLAVRECQRLAAVSHRKLARRLDDALANVVALLREDAEFRNALELGGVTFGGPLEPIALGDSGMEHPGYSRYDRWRSDLVSKEYLPERR